MNKKMKTVLSVLLAVVLLGGVGYYSYAKYTNTLSGDATATAATWKVKVNTIDMSTEAATLTENLNLTLDANTNVANGKIAPGRGGYFDITIDPEGTEVSFDYTISLGDVEDMPNGMAITGYTIDNGEKVTGTSIPTQTVALVNGTAFAAGQTKTVRVYVAWTDSEANNADDTAKAGTTVTIPVTVTVSQHIA